MITDAMLKEAILEMNEVILSSYPDPEDCHVDFSPRFERKMKSVIRKGNHPDFYRFRQQAVNLLLILFLCFTTLMALSPVARAAVIGWIQDKYESYFRYSSQGLQEKHTTTTNDGYQITYIPDGYQHYKSITRFNKTKEIYCNSIGNELQIMIIKNTGNDIYIEDKNIGTKTTTINGLEAQLYLSEKENGTNNIVWFNKEQETLFVITAVEEEKIIIKIAENIK